MDLLIKRAKKGDKNAFVQLMKENELSLYKVAKSILKNDEDVADAMQETILSALENISSLKQDKYFKTWLTRILINKCNTILRKNSKTIQLKEYFDAGYTENFIQSISIKEGIQTLSDEQKLVLHLYYVMGFNSREISELLNEKESTVKVRLSRSRNKLKDFFQGNKRGDAVNG
ncbi:sigma-70 family RNA polymerase sigma factor [Romboutsia weinsteinii]|uniref:Sigma-70 family RNA polymerase sigma factor n=1 Tax=Romboutsia weinsteinii TaxID=2020949 RepID=A0A371J211_9FIRM|nr:sigma-70 family RNA polymerase sigma factor [Romboutsia weinsteinii]RDY26706.1 sigma-70 family RNA polymerase sigma factor [Romboutsia weinsteinii]